MNATGTKRTPLLSVDDVARELKISGKQRAKLSRFRG